MKVSKYFKLNRTQPYLDFVDVRLDTDIEAFVDPSAIRALQSAWGNECVSLLQHYFETILSLIKQGDDTKAIALLASLNERNEFHLGYSSGKSQGRAFGQRSAAKIWKALIKSKAAKSALLKDIEDTCLLIEGIDKDMISDAVCNIIRGPLLKYTHDMCVYYGIPLTPSTDSGPIWNPLKEKWERQLVPLPMTRYGKLVLVPKIIVRHDLSYRAGEYYRHYLLPIMQQEELKANSALVQVLKDGRRRVTKRSLIDKYGFTKLAIVEQTIKHPSALTHYKNVKRKSPAAPLTHEELAEFELASPPEWDELLKEVVSIPVGESGAASYEDAIEKLLTALFYPFLCSPVKQHNIHEGRKRIDITYVNEARKGFFSWLSQHYTAPHVFVECKNYGKKVSNPEIDQLSGRFSPSRGKVGILVCRKIQDKIKLLKRCRDTADDHRGFIIPIDDDDLSIIIKERRIAPNAQDFAYFRKLFNKLIM